MEDNELFNNIERSIQNAHEANAATKIIDQLKKLRYSNNENSAKRWVWELCQNAMDVRNSTGKVRIKILFNEEKKKVLFCHNGKPFNVDNLVYLIEQVSTKDRTLEGDERKSGKFGTGFLTTHLLSEIVNVSGILEEKQGKLAHFNITLDRTGRNTSEIIQSIHSSIEQLHNCVPIEENECIDENNYNTIFEYKLDDDGIEVAKQGLQNLRISAPFVLSMLRDIEEISIEPQGEVYFYKEELNSDLKNAIVHKIVHKCSGKISDKYVLNLTEDNVTVSTMFELKDDNIYIKEYNQEQPKLFCDFPLVGTDDFPLPVIVSSSYFNPTEPRDGIFLMCKSKVEDEIEENRSLLKTGCVLYRKLLDYVSVKRWQGIYNITNIKEYQKKEWHDEEWIKEEILKSCKYKIVTAPIINNCDNRFINIEDSFGDEKAFIISDIDENIRENLWKTASSLYPDFIPCYSDFHEWYNSLWKECRNFTVRKLTIRLDKMGDLEKLRLKLRDEEWTSWLEKYYNLVSCKKEILEEIKNNKFAVIPNQNGVFCKMGVLRIDDNIYLGYKEILRILGVDCQEWLIHSKIVQMEWYSCKHYGNEDILKMIEERIAYSDKEKQNVIYFKIISLSKENYPEEGKQKKIVEYAASIFKMDSNIKAVGFISEKLLDSAMKHVMTSIADYISECRNIEGLAHYMEISSDEAMEWLSDFIDFIVKNGYENLLNKITKPILPNQNRLFVIKDNLFLDDEIHNTLKDLAKIAGYDVRNELLENDVCIELPNNRVKKNEDLVTCITQYVKNNRGSDKEDIRFFFRKLLLWINDNEDKAKRIFEELYEKKFFLYDDKEIAENIKKAETYDNLMQKYNITSPERLEQMICRSRSFIGNISEEKEKVTDEILIQFGIDSEEALEKAYSNRFFSENFARDSIHKKASFEYVQAILERSKNKIIEFLKGKDEYDLSDIQEIDKTIFIIKKGEEEIYLLTRPSDGGEIRLYYDTEKDILDFSKDWELWVEDGESEPQKITFGKMIKLTGINRIPLRNIRENE